MLKKAITIAMLLFVLTLAVGCRYLLPTSGTANPQTTASTLEETPQETPTSGSSETAAPSETAVQPSETTAQPTQTSAEPVEILYLTYTDSETHSIDLNGDGSDELITYNVFNDYSFQLIVNDQIAGETGANFLMSHFFVTDLDIYDGYLDIAVQELGPSDDYFTYFFYYDGQNLILRGSVAGTICDPYSNALETDPYGLGTILLDGLGGLTARARGDVLYTWFYPQPWILDSQGDLVLLEQDYIALTGFDEETYEETPEAEVILKMNLPLYEEPGDTSAALIIQAGETGYLVKTDNIRWVQMRTTEDILGWFELGDNSYSVLVGASEYFSEEVFAGLWFAD